MNVFGRRNVIDFFLDKNYCFFVLYIDYDNYNKDFLHKFFHLIYNEKAKKNNIKHTIIKISH